MLGKFGIRGTVVMGLAALSAVPCYAGDKETVVPGPINSIADLQDTANLVFKLADTNNDDQISQQEATDAGNLVVGGFFFRADTNGDGVLTAQEAQQARDTLFAQQPLLKYVFERAKPTNTTQNSAPVLPGGAVGANNNPRQIAQSLAADPMQTINNLLDTNHDQKIEATELRQAVQMGVTTLFLLADGNQDGQLSPYELNAAITEVGKSAVQAAFQAADADRNSMLSMEEYDKALAEPAHAVFRVLDGNADNQLTIAELERAEQIIWDQIQRLRVPEPANSLANQLQGRNGSRSSQFPNQNTPYRPAGSAPVVAPTSGLTPPPR